MFDKIQKLAGPNCCQRNLRRCMAVTAETSSWRNKEPKRSFYEGPIVISGISGRLPKSSTMEEFKLNLLNGVDMTTEEKRWKDDRIPQRHGFLKCLDKFDAGFFNQTPTQADQMDPQIRLLLEATFEAILDSGFSPSELRGSPTGVFSAALGGETLEYRAFHYNSDLLAHSALSANNFLIPAKIAFVFDLQGPSSHMSSACSASLTAVEAAVNGIILGKFDAAIVTGSNVCLSPRASLGYAENGAVSRDGHCKAFDESGDGFARAEAAVAILIQKESVARRSYGRIVNVRSRTDGFKHEGMPYPSGKVQEMLIREVYQEMGIDPTNEVFFVEAHGTGTPVGDPVELGSIYSIFSKSPTTGPATRKKPLLLGSVKSNMGHAESAAGMASIAKVISSIQLGAIPSNLHFRKPAKALEHLFFPEGNLKVVVEPTPLLDQAGLIGINSFGIGGTNSHLIFEPGKFSGCGGEDCTNQLPVLFPFAGRTGETVEESLKEASARAVGQPEYRFLLQKAFGTGIPGFSYRGFGLIAPGREEQQAQIFNVQHCKSPNPPLWVIFPGMGSQWAGMGKDLMRIEPFAESIHRSCGTMKNIGLDLDQLLEESSTSIFTSIRDAMVVIAALQIALWDTLTELKLNPQGFIGHSNGEFFCAYADGCVSAEETLLMSDARGRALIEGQLKAGGMASIGMNPEELQGLVPHSIDIACYNSPRNVTISGQLDDVLKFVEELKCKGKFASMINSCGIAAHGRLVGKSGDIFMEYVSGILGNKERVRSERWISTCVTPEDTENFLTSANKTLASPEYFKRNVEAPVRFYQACKHIPSGAVVLEVSPKGFFQRILKDSAPKDCLHIAPMSSKAEDKMLHFLQSVGHLHISGLDVDIANLYPKVPLPVSADTPWISPLVKWDHSRSWKTHILNYPLEAGMERSIDLKSPSHAVLKGHKVENRILYPATGYVVQAWTHFEDVHGLRPQSTPVVLRNVVLRRPTLLDQERPSVLFCTLLSGSGTFEFKDQVEVIVSGRIGFLEHTENLNGTSVNQCINELGGTRSSEWLPLNTDDIYKEFRLRGYNYSGAFRGIHRMDNEGKWAEVVWKEDWITFLDTMLQACILTTTTRNLSLAVEIEQITIDPAEFLKNLEILERHGPEKIDKIVRVAIDHTRHTIICPGVEIKGLITTNIPTKTSLNAGKLALQKFEFCPLTENLPELQRETCLWEMVDLVLENIDARKLDVADIFTDRERSGAKAFTEIMSLRPLRDFHLDVFTLTSEAEEQLQGAYDSTAPSLTKKEKASQLVPESAVDLILLGDPDLLASVVEKVKPSGFLMIHSNAESMPEIGLLESFVLVAQKKSETTSVALYRKMDGTKATIFHAPLQEDGTAFQWLKALQDILQSPVNQVSPSRVYITSQNPSSGVLGMFKCLLKEEQSQGKERRLRCIFDPERKLNLNFAQPDDPMVQRIIAMDLVVNVVQNGQLGSYRHVPLAKETETSPCGGLAKQVEDAFITTITPGDLSSLRWVQSPPFEMNHNYNNNNEQHTLGGRHKLYDIAYAAMNFRDILLATATIPIESTYTYKESYMGFEFSGFDQQGNRVMGLGEGGLLATRGLADPLFVWPMPDHWTFEEAATVPLVYTTVLYGFEMRAGGLKPGQRVLIHAGTGGIGMAAINLALAHGCEVFTTVGSERKRDILQKLFPSINHDHIGNSRDTSFESQFLQVTEGQGVDIILNSLAGDKLTASLRCLAINGKFLEIGIYDAHQNMPLGMRSFLKNMDFASIELYHVLGDNAPRYSAKLTRLLQAGTESGAVKPLPREVFQRNQLEQAFRFMASGNHVGKVLIKVRDGDGPLDPSHIPVAAVVGRSYFSKDKLYIIVGGLGGFGLELANWLTDRGARNLILTSRSGVTNGYQSYCIRKWTVIKGAHWETPILDLSKKEEAEVFIRDIVNPNSNASGSECCHQIGGIFNCALVLEDKEFSKQTAESFSTVYAPKAKITEYLDQLSRKLCPNLDHFVVFSSLSCGRGTAEQTNYGWANSVAERICEARKRDGLHGLALQWGVIGQVGYVAEKVIQTGGDGTEEIAGTLPQNVESCLEVLDAALLQRKHAILASMVVAPKEKATIKGEKGALITRIENIFGLKDMEETVSPDRKLSELGMDSTIAFELKQLLERDYDLPMTRESLRLLTVRDLIAIDAGTYSLTDSRANVQRNEVQLQQQEQEQGCLLKLESAQKGPQLFMVHGVLGVADIFSLLASKLHADVFAFQLRHGITISTVRHLAWSYIQEMKCIQSEGPYLIVGYSGGASVAYEMAVQLEHQGHEVTDMILLDGHPTFAMESAEAVRQMALSGRAFSQLTEEQGQELGNNMGAEAAKDSEKVLQSHASPLVPVDVAYIKQRLDLLQAVKEYAESSLGTYSGRTVAIQAQQSKHSEGHVENFKQRCVGPLLFFTVHGDHESFLAESHVGQTATILNSLLHSKLPNNQ